MKKVIIFIMMLLIFLGSIGIGYFYLNTREDQKKESKINENILIQNVVENEIISTETKEKKISPNAEITTTILYKKCGHEIIETKKIEKEDVNLNENELKEKFKDFTIETFSENQLSLYKEEEKMCNEHYNIGEDSGYISIYKLDEDGKEELYEQTNISLEYLPQEEQEKIKKKIEVIGKEDLYKALENFES